MSQSGKFSTGKKQGEASTSTAAGVPVGRTTASGAAPPTVGTIDGQRGDMRFNDTSTPGQLYPREWVQRREAVDRIGRHVELVQLDQGRGDLLGARGLLGARSWQPEILADIDKAQDELTDAKLRQFAISKIADRNSLEGRKYLQELYPGHEDAELQYLKLALKQLEYLVKLGHKSRFSDHQEFERIVWILGAGEPLICMTHPAIANLYNWNNQWGPVVNPRLGMADVGSEDHLGYFLKWNHLHPWFVNRAGHVEIRVKIAESVMHLFPKAMFGATDVMRGQYGTRQDVQQRAAALVEECENMVHRATSGEWLATYVNNVKHPNGGGLRALLGGL